MKKSIEDYNKEISTLKQLNEELKLKLDEKQKELNLFSNISINICNEQNTSSPHSQLEKCPYCIKKICKKETKHENSPNLEMSHFQKIVPNWDLS